MDKNDLLNQKINWKPFGDYKGFRYALLNVDMKKKLIDLLFQFDANQQCFYHRHYHPNHPHHRHFFIVRVNIIMRLLIL